MTHWSHFPRYIVYQKTFRQRTALIVNLSICNLVDSPLWSRISEFSCSISRSTSFGSRNRIFLGRCTGASAGMRSRCFFPTKSWDSFSLSFLSRVRNRFSAFLPGRNQHARVQMRTHSTLRYTCNRQCRSRGNNRSNSHYITRRRRTRAAYAEFRTTRKRVCASRLMRDAIPRCQC